MPTLACMSLVKAMLTHEAVGNSCPLPGRTLHSQASGMGQYRPRLCVAIHMLHDTTSWAFFKDFLYKRYLEGRLRHFDVA